MKQVHERRAVLGESFEDCNHLRVEHVKYYEFNTVAVLVSIIVTCLVWSMVTGAYLATVLDILAG